LTQQPTPFLLSRGGRVAERVLLCGVFFHKILLLQGFFCGGGGLLVVPLLAPSGAALAGVIPASSLPQ